MMTPDELNVLLKSPEGRRVEFKTAARSFEFEDLVKYCVALANEGGDTIVLGVTDRRPREVIGTQALEVKSSRAPVALPGLAVFSEAFRPRRTLLVGGDGIPVDEFLSRPVADWLQP
jgi:hypothetical protein